MQILRSLAPLLYLACPIMMVLCMRGMLRGGGSSSRDLSPPTTAATPSEQRVATLEQEVAELHARLGDQDAAQPSSNEQLRDDRGFSDAALRRTS